MARPNSSILQEELDKCDVKGHGNINMKLINEELAAKLNFNFY